MKEEIKKEEVELAERYANALETIQKLEENLEQAEKYAVTLKEIEDSEVSVEE